MAAQEMYGAQRMNTGVFTPSHSAVISDFNTMVAAATDFLVLQNPVGSGRKLKITEVRLNGGATAAALYDLYAFIRTALNTGGTSTSVAISAYDSTDVLPVASVLKYTANPTLNGTGVLIRGESLVVGSITAAVNTVTPSTIIWKFGDRPCGCPTIYPGQQFSLSNNGNAVPAGLNLYASIEWTGENL